MAPAALLWICAFVVAGVFAVMIHSIATFRSAQPGAARIALAEVFWAIVPIVIMVSTALPAVRMLAAEHAAQDTSVVLTTAFNADRK